MASTLNYHRSRNSFVPSSNLTARFDLRIARHNSLPFDWWPGMANKVTLVWGGCGFCEARDSR